jgi:hypothetical protein
MGVDRPSHREIDSAVEKALAGEGWLRLSVTPDRHFVPVDDARNADPVDDSGGVNETDVYEADPEISAAVRSNRERLERLRQEPYLDLTVWGPFSGVKGVALVIGLAVALAAATVAGAIPSARAIGSGVAVAAAILFSVGLLVAYAWSQLRKR